MSNEKLNNNYALWVFLIMKIKGVPMGKIIKKITEEINKTKDKEYKKGLLELKKLLTEDC